MSFTVKSVPKGNCSRTGSHLINAWGRTAASLPSLGHISDPISFSETRPHAWPGKFAQERVREPACGDLAMAVTRLPCLGNTVPCWATTASADPGAQTPAHRAGSRLSRRRKEREAVEMPGVHGGSPSGGLQPLQRE